MQHRENLCCFLLGHKWTKTKIKMKKKKGGEGHGNCKWIKTIHGVQEI